MNERIDSVCYMVYVRKLGDGVDLNSIIHEFLHMYYPKASEKKIIEASKIFEFAFQCYEKLFNEQPLRDFFVELCKENDTLFKWAGLRKASFSQVLRYEKELINSENSLG